MVGGFAVVALLVFASFPPSRGEMGVNLVLLGVMAVFAALTAAFAPERESRQDIALCTLIGAFWAYAVGYGQYWSTCEWFWGVDGVVIVSACLFAQARLCRKRSVAWLVACAVLLVPLVVISGVAGATARGLTDDPRM